MCTKLMIGVSQFSYTFIDGLNFLKAPHTHTHSSFERVEKFAYSEFE